jgi:hypothetical protein
MSQRALQELNQTSGCTPITLRRRTIADFSHQTLLPLSRNISLRLQAVARFRTRAGTTFHERNWQEMLKSCKET